MVKLATTQNGELAEYKSVSNYASQMQLSSYH